MKTKKAFSLTELSIVILVIGILIAGVTLSSKMIEKAKISTARNQTQNSPIASIKDLSLWIESTSDKSFDITEQENDSVVSNWYDLNPQNISKVNFTSTSTARPLFKNNVINNLPAIKFDGSNDFMSASGFPNIASEITLFALIKSPPTAGNQTFIAKRGPSISDPVNFQASFFNTSAGGGNGWQYCVPGGSCKYSIPAVALSTNTAYVVSIVFTANSSSATAITFFENGTQVTTGNSSTTGLTPEVSTANLYLGKTNTEFNYWFSGYIGEIVIFHRTLKAEERKSVEVYLGKKWGVQVAS